MEMVAIKLRRNGSNKPNGNDDNKAKDSGSYVELIILKRKKFGRDNAANYCIIRRY